MDAKGEEGGTLENDAISFSGKKSLTSRLFLMALIPSGSARRFY